MSCIENGEGVAGHQGEIALWRSSLSARPEKFDGVRTESQSYGGAKLFHRCLTFFSLASFGRKSQMSLLILTQVPYVRMRRKELSHAI